MVAVSLLALGKSKPCDITLQLADFIAKIARTLPMLEHQDAKLDHVPCMLATTDSWSRPIVQLASRRVRCSLAPATN